MLITSEYVSDLEGLLTSALPSLQIRFKTVPSPIPEWAIGGEGNGSILCINQNAETLRNNFATLWLSVYKSR